MSVGTLGGGAYVIFLPLCFPLLLSVAVRHLGYTRINLSGQSIATFWMVIVTATYWCPCFQKTTADGVIFVNQKTECDLEFVCPCDYVATCSYAHY